ncbi:PREDICTED: tyrosine-protein kinase RYK isoform X2 [Rhagoletis zephyria]|uniref:tyrosine-protein kinase RYK isoform X2 n=1 Tax=Rhagoletis zephyria TaxID=28612 RepID=UPI0008114081|nr:PREDICTED: tyrosine-protein kinase RYK isoform X2 [Rhagoletis zephyria]
MISKFWLNVWCALVVSWFPLLTDGYLNVFISHREVIKLMGLEADLFYVHEGAINTYAMHFTVPVPADVHDLEFSWQSLTTYPLPYTITIDYEQDQTALAAPTLSIPDKGYVPQQIETFLVHLPCTGNGNKEVPLVVNMLVSGPPRTNDTKLHFKRNKICLKGLFPAPNQSAAPAQAPSPGHALLGAAACALGLVLVVGLVASAMYVRARKQIRQDSMHTSFTTAAYGSHQNVFIRLDPLGRPPSANSGSYATIASLNKYPSESKKSCNIFDRFRSSPPTPSPYATALLPMGRDHIADTIYSKPESICPSRISYYASSQLTQVYSMSTPKSSRGGGGGGGGNGSVFGGASSSAGSGSDPKEKLRRIPNVQPGTLMCQHLIKEGTYGRIYAGNLGDACDVIIKTVVDGASLTQVACLLQEASTLIGVCHPNILTPLLANTELPGPPEIAYPYPSKGNLKIYLQKSRELNSPLSTRQLVEFGLHVTKGLAHLHSMGIIHRDVATRNCYLDMDCYVKICDSALSRDLFPDDYHCLGDNENRPLKWMALESLQKKYFNTYSDIWTLGVLFWELATLALTPFEEVDIFELSAYLSDGFRLGQPINCPDEFFTVMSCCWLEDPKQRPSFPQLLAYLQDFHEDLGKYI